MELETFVCFYRIIVEDLYMIHGLLGMFSVKTHLTNSVLFGKWLWEFAQESRGLWRMIIAENLATRVYGGKNPMNTINKSLWRGIWVKNEIFWENIHFQIGDGQRVKFWTDRWATESSFSSQFPQFYQLCITTYQAR